MVTNHERDREVDPPPDAESSFGSFAPHPYHTMDSDGKIITVNDVWLDTLGYDRDEVKGEWFGNFLRNISEAEFESMFRKYKETGRVSNIEYEIEDADGDTIVVSYDGTIEYDEDGEFVRTHCQFTEITDRKRREQELRQYKQAIEGSTDLLGAADLDENILFVNEKYREYHGLSSAEAIGASLEDFLGEDTYGKIEPYLQRVYEGEEVNFEMERTGPDGELRTLDIRYYPLRDVNGDIHGSVIAMRDITPQKLYMESVQRLSEYRRVMSEINQRLVRATDIGAMMNMTTEILTSSDLFRCSFICLTEGAEKKHVFERGSGLSLAEIQSFHTSEYLDSVFEESPVVIDDVTRSPHTHHDGDGPSHSGVAVAIRSQGEEYGVLTVHSPVDSSPDDDDIELLRELADDLGFFIRNQVLEREQAEAHRELQRSEQRYRNLFEQSLNGISIHEIVTNKNGNPVDYVYQEVNATFEQLTGLSSDEVTGKRATEVFPNQDYGPFINKFGQVALENETVAFEAYFAPLEIYLAIKAFPLEGERFVTTFTDISERVEHEQDLRKFNRAVEASGHAIFITESDGTIRYVNPAFEDITGFSREEAKGVNPRILKSGEVPEEHYEELWETILAGDNWTEEIINQRKDGKSYHAHQTVAPIMDDDGEISGFVAIQTDISDLKEMEENLKERTRQLSIMDRVLRHNLRNDLNIIEGYAEIIHNSSSDEHKTYSEHILDECDQLLHTAEKQREITHLLVDPPDIREIDLSSVAHQSATEIQERYPYAEISVSVPKSAIGRATPEIKQAIDELLGNAVAYSDQSVPTVEVLVNEAENEPKITIEVADDGPGIPDMEKDVLLEEDSIEPLYHGSGLGLRLVNVIVSQSNGTLSFEENEPRGSIVEIVLEEVI